MLARQGGIEGGLHLQDARRRRPDVSRLGPVLGLLVLGDDTRRRKRACGDGDNG
jgi:hypothetical protein